MGLFQHILCIDDDLINQEVVTDFLEDEYSVVCADNGKAGLAAIEKQVPHLILLDVMMPVMDGLEVMKRLKMSPELCHIPVVVISALSYKEEIGSMYDMGADAYITKPFLGAELKKVISGLI